MLNGVPLLVQLDDLASHHIGGAVFRRIVVCRPGNDQRRAGFIDQNAVDLVNNGVIQRALHLQVGPLLHIVAEIIKAELGVRAVRDVRAIGVPPRIATWIHVGLNPADINAEVAERRRHPVRVAADEIIVDRHHVAVHPLQHTQKARERSDKRLAFTGGHLGDPAFVQDQAADQLHIEATRAKRRAAVGKDPPDAVIHRDGNRHGLPGFAAGDHLLLRGVVGSVRFVAEERAVVIVRVEILLGVENFADADVPIHRLTNDRQRLGNHAVDRELLADDACAKLLRTSAKLLIGKLLNFGLIGIDLLDDAKVTLEQTIIAAAKNFGQHLAERNGHDKPRIVRTDKCGKARRRRISSTPAAGDSAARRRSAA